MEVPRRLPRIGGRVWKTGVAVALSLAICRALQIPEPVFAGVAAVICMQPTVLQTLRKGLERLQATAIGAIVALGMLALVMLFPYPYVRSFATGAAVIIVLWLCLLLKWLDALVLAAATVVVVMIHSEDHGNIMVYAAQRFLVTAIGIVVASFVNAFVFWPKVDSRFPKRLPEVAARAFSEFERAVRAFYSRNMEEAATGLDNCRAEQATFEQASSELAWFRDSDTVKHKLPIHHAELAPALAEVYTIIESIHKNAEELFEDTVAVLRERPDYTVEDARVYEIIADAMKPASELGTAIVEALQTGDNSALKDTGHAWTRDLHMQFVRGIRAAHRSPRDIFPLFEVAKVGVELRNHTRQLTRLKDLLIENEQVLSALRRYR